MLVTVCGGRGAPGVSTVALGLAASWPSQAPDSVVLLEADPAGASVPFRLRGADGEPLSLGTGVVQWVAAMRGGMPPSMLQFAQRLDGGLPVMVGPGGAQQASAIGSSWSSLAMALASPGGPVVVADIGRLLTPTAVVAPLVAQAQVVVVVVRASLEGAAAMRAVLSVVSAIRGAANPLDGGLAGVRVVAVNPTRTGRFHGSAKRASRDVSEVLAALPGICDVPVAGAVPWDERTVRAWYEGAAMPRRSPLVGACEQISAELDSLLTLDGGEFRVRR